MKTFQVEDRTFSGYLAEPTTGNGPGVVVLHAWWGLTEPFQRVCDRLADAGFVALAPDLYHGKTIVSVEEAEALGAALDQDEERWRGDIAAAIQFLRKPEVTQASSQGKLALVGFSLGDAYALETSVNLPEEIAAVVFFYGCYPGLDYRRAKAAYLSQRRGMLWHHCTSATHFPCYRAEQQSFLCIKCRRNPGIMPGKKADFAKNRTRAMARNNPMPLPKTHTRAASANDVQDLSYAAKKGIKSDQWVRFLVS